MDDKTSVTIFKQEPPQSWCCWLGWRCWPSWCCCKRQVTYRIPALIYISESKTYFAFAEKRKTPSDTDADKLVMRKGLWKDDKNTIEWDSGLQELPCLPNHRSMNPCPVYERESKTLFLFFICVPDGVSESSQIEAKKNKARLCYVTNKKWNNITELKDVIREKEKNWATFAVGPGHGIQMKSGRLIIPAYVYYFVEPNAPKSHAVTFYSDDKGSIWHVGERMQVESIECQMAEIDDGGQSLLLYCNARSTSGYRVEALSRSRREVFDKPLTVKKLKETDKGCQGSVLYIPSSALLLYSHPTDKNKRKDLGIYVNKSPSDPNQWDCKDIINKGPSGYSDLAECENREYIACLMECGQETEIEEIAFKLFKINDAVESSQVDSP